MIESHKKKHNPMSCLSIVDMAWKINHFHIVYIESLIDNVDMMWYLRKMVPTTPSTLSSYCIYEFACIYVKEPKIDKEPLERVFLGGRLDNKMMATTYTRHLK